MERGEREAYAAVVGPGSCLSAVAFRGHGRGPIEGGLCPHKWLPGSAVAHLPLIPTPGLTFASSFLSSPLPLIPSPFPLSLLSLSLSLSPPMRIYPPLPPSNPQTILHRISLSLSLFLSLFPFVASSTASPSSSSRTLSRLVLLRHTCAPRAPSNTGNGHAYLFLDIFRTDARYTPCYTNLGTRCRRFWTSSPPPFTILSWRNGEKTCTTSFVWYFVWGEGHSYDGIRILTN